MSAPKCERHSECAYPVNGCDGCLVVGLRADLATVTAERNRLLAAIANANTVAQRALEERDDNTREFGRLYGEQDKSRAEAYQRLETEREGIAAYLDHVASVEVGTVLSATARGVVGCCAAWVRNRLDEKWAKEGPHDRP